MRKISIFIASALGLLLSACDQQMASETAPAENAGPPPVQITAMTAEIQDVPVSFEYVGQVEGSNEVEIHARINGIIEKRLFDEGAGVKQGQVLFLIDPAPYEAQLAQAEAALASAEATKSSALAQLKQAQREYKRITPLSKQNLISQKELDSAESGVELAQAALRQSEAAILQAQANISSARINLAYTKITAPISGIVGRAQKKEGSLAEVGSNSLLTTVARTNPVFINFGVAETEHIQRQQDIKSGALLIPETGFDVAIQTTTGARLEQTGKVNFQDYKVDANTGNFSMRATLDNQNQALSPGQFVRVILQGAKRSGAILLPQRAVLDSPQGKYVYVVANGEQGGSVAERRPVSVGEWVQLEGEFSNAWIITSGLNPGEQIVVEGMARIFFPGMPIEVAPAAENIAPPNQPTETSPSKSAN